MAVYKSDTLIEQSIYGSSRLGLVNYATKTGYRSLGGKKYELSNHLGNVLAVVSDNIHLDQDSTWTSLINTTDYYPFGLAMDGRSEQDSTYRYGFGGHEKVDEVKEEGSTVDMGDRWLDVMIGRTFKPDAKGVLYPGASPYSYALNTPIQAIDPDGKVVIFVNGNHYGDGGTSTYWRQYKTDVVWDRKPSQWMDPGQYHYENREVYAFDTQVKQQFGDYKARYYDGALGGWAPFNINNNTQTSGRYVSGYMQAKTDADDIISNLQRDAGGNITETIKIVSHSMGSVYSKGFAHGLQDYIETNKLQGVKIEIDFAPFQPNDPLNAAIDGVPTYQASHSDDSIAGNKPGKGSKQIDTSSDTGQRHSIFDFKSTVNKLGSLIKDVRNDKR